MTDHKTETVRDAWQRRAALKGDVDFTMMYVAHDAFNRDLTRLVKASQEGRGFTPEADATWRMFSQQLHTHHTAEDTSLWPRLRAVVTAADEIAILDAMEAEHAELDPLLERVDVALADRRESALVDELGELRARLAAHMRHEEDAALPLLERRLGAPGWAAFGQEIREQQGGLRGGAEYLPWVLDDAADHVKRQVLGLLPGPARLLYRYVWERKYRNAGRLA
jgi:iron-sulfur cluster repair protein YtfE (RIC family)